MDMDMDMDTQVLNQLVGLNPTMLQNLKLTDFHLPPQQSEFPATNYHFLPTTSKSERYNSQAFTHINAFDEDVCNNNKKKKKAVKVMEQMGKNESLGKGNKCETKRGEVIHVRARRGQATDSHSLAERVRRQRINSRFKCLQDIVPGCHKTMGMSVMLDEIINYVQSLQNQVEFLSMQLASSASSSYVFNSNGDHAIARNVAPQHQEKYTRGDDNRLKL